MNNHRSLPPHERKLSLYPATLAGTLILLALMLNGPILWPQDPLKSAIITLFGALGAVYIIFFNLVLVPSRKYKPTHAWMHAVLASLGMVGIFAISPEKLEIYLSILMALSVISLSILGERPQAYLVLISTTVAAIIVHCNHLTPLATWIVHPGMAIIAIIMIESIQRLRHLSQQQIQRLEIINEFNRQVTSSIDTQQVISLVNEAIRAALQADTYYLGLSEGDQINLKLLYDDGEYFTDQRVAMEGTLSGWVIQNQQELFLPDLRRELNIPGIQLVIVGKDRASLSWMGVPMNGAHVHGLIAVGSYQPYAFDRSDLELLANLTQHATLALDNAYHHALVEEQARLDSLTGVYNHGYF
ncbi:MAG: GAF domain-containing protein, partial [Anaerolineae bacterium]